MMVNDYRRRLTALLLGAAWLPQRARAAALPALAMEAQPNARAASAALLCMALAGRRVLAAGERGLVIWSDDGGEQWRQASVPVSVSLTRMVFTSDTDGWAVGHGGVMLSTGDGGKTWRKVCDGVQLAARAPAGQEEVPGADKPWFDVAFTSQGAGPATGFAVGAYGMLYRTDDAGRNWQPWMAHADNPKGLHLYALARAGETLYIAGEQGLLLKSVDGGATFKRVPLPYQGSLFGLQALEGGDLYVYGLRGMVLRSKDQGRNWQVQPGAAAAGISAALPLSPLRMLFAGQSGQLYMSQPGRDGLRRVDGYPSAPFTALQRMPDGSVLAASLRGVVRLMPPAGLVALVEGAR